MPPADRRDFAQMSALLQVVRRTNAAITALEDARAALTELRKLGRPIGQSPRHLRRAEAAVRRGVTALGKVPTPQYGQSRDRRDPLWRCHHCDVLVFGNKLRGHLVVFHDADVETDQLGLHFTLAPEPEEGP